MHSSFNFSPLWCLFFGQIKKIKYSIKNNLLISINIIKSKLIIDKFNLIILVDMKRLFLIK